MSQSDVYNILKSDPTRWFTCKEVKEILLSKGYSNGTIINVNNDLLKLATFNIILTKMTLEINSKRVYKYSN